MKNFLDLCCDIRYHFIKFLDTVDVDNVDGVRKLFSCRRCPFFSN